MFRQKINCVAHRLAPWLPPAWRLQFLAWAYSQLDAEVELTHLEKIGPCRGTAIDAGANCGYYSLALAKLYRQVISFEPNREACEPLVAAGLPNVRIVHVGLSSANRMETLFVPIANDVKMSGWGSLDDHNCPEATAVVAQQIELRTLDSQRLTDVRFIKIDVEGHELHVLRGAAILIQRDHPHLLVEIRKANQTAVLNLLSNWGYREANLLELAGVLGTPRNRVFIPEHIAHPTLMSKPD